MFKRSIWDEQMRPYAKGFYEEVVFQQKVGYRKLDYAFRNAAWNLEWGFGFGNTQSNSGLYSWDGVPAKMKRFVETGDQVKDSPEEMSHIIKKVARFIGADLVGICKVHPNWVYSHEFNPITGEYYPIQIPEGCHHAIVMAVAMDYDAIRSSPSGVSGAATGLGYSKMAFVANLLAVSSPEWTVSLDTTKCTRQRNSGIPFKQRRNGGRKWKNISVWQKKLKWSMQ
jgi:hypothetical protein